MGWPLLVGLALAGTGTGLQFAGAEASKSAMNRRMTEEMKRQRKYQGAASAEFAGKLAESGPAVETEGQDAGSQAAVEQYRKLQQLVMPEMSASGENKTIESQQREGERNRANNAAGTLFGYNEAALRRQIRNMQVNQMLALQTSNAQRSGAVLPFELQDASHAGDTLGMAGQGLGLAGSLLGLYGLTLPAKAATTVGANAITTGAKAAPYGGFGGGLFSSI